MLKNNKFIFILGLLSLIITTISLMAWLFISSPKSDNATDKPEKEQVVGSEPPQSSKSKPIEAAQQAEPESEPKPKDNESSVLSAEEAKIIKTAHGTGLSSEVLQLALKAYYNAAAEGEVNNHKLTIIDYSMPSNKKRMWMIDMDKKSIDLNTYVSHGVKSGDKVAKEFSNKPESHKSSIGVMKTGSIYTGGKGISLHLHGLEKEFNSNVYDRHVVIHGTQYVSDAIAKTKGKIGKSLGCPAVDYKVAKPLIKKIANGSIVFAYYPMKSWLKKSEYLM